MWSLNGPWITKATVTWDAVEHADSYEVILYRSDIFDQPSQVGDYTNIGSTTFTEPLVGLTSIWYTYQVVAHNRFGSNSSELSDTNALTVPLPESPPSTGQGSSPEGPHHPLTPVSAPNKN